MNVLFGYLDKIMPNLMIELVEKSQIAVKLFRISSYYFDKM